jgi:hypothetical protein
MMSYDMDELVVHGHRVDGFHSPKLQARAAEHLIATEQVARMTTAILKDFRRRLDYDSRLTSKVEGLKLGRPAIRRTERMAAIGEACLQMSPSTRHPAHLLAIFLVAALSARKTDRCSLRAAIPAGNLPPDPSRRLAVTAPTRRNASTRHHPSADDCSPRCCIPALRRRLHEPPRRRSYQKMARLFSAYAALLGDTY